MISCKYVLSGIDLGPDTAENIAYTAYFASKTGATVRLLYIIDYLLTPPAYLTSYVEDEKKGEEKEISRLQTLLNGFGIKAESSVKLGRLHESFMQVIRETSADLLVIGYKTHLLRPSSSERLVKSLAMPMLVLRGRYAENASPGTVTIRKILCPVDFSGNSGKAISMAKGYAELFSADLHIMHAIPSHMIQERWKQWGLQAKDRERFKRELYSETLTKFSQLRKEFNITAEGEIVHGTPGEMICSVADAGTYDLIVMGARGLSYLQGVLIGSTTESVLKASPCPVLVVH